MKARPRTPLWVRATLVTSAVALCSFLTATHLDRIHNEHRLAAIASQIAGRPVKVHCPGILARHLDAYDVEGSVQFDAHGRPSDTTDLRAMACAELDALAEGRRAAVLRCPACSGQAGLDLAFAADTLTHESYHLSGIMAEAVTECHSLARMAWTAERLGATPAQAAALADLQRQVNYPRMPEQYRMDCGTVTGS